MFSQTLHRFAQLVAFCTFLLICAGGLVTSTDSGLSVPDWPTTYGYNMFTFPFSKMVGGIFYEHTHRLIASTVGLLTIVLAIWLTLREKRKWLVTLGWIALAAVIIQGILGGLTVKFFLPAPVSVSHAGLAKIFFLIAIAIAFFTSPGSTTANEPRAVGSGGLSSFAVALTILVYLQIMVGAVMRHTYDSGVGFAIPDFPLSNGSLIPEFTSPIVAVHFAHRVLGATVALFIFTLAYRTYRNYRNTRILLRPALALCALVAIQISLGALTLWTQQGGLEIAFFEPVVWITTLHQTGGALILGTAFLISLRYLRLERRGKIFQVADDATQNENDYALQV